MTDHPVSPMQADRKLTVLDLCYTVFMRARVDRNSDDGGPVDWFNDTKPLVDKWIEENTRAAIAPGAGAKGRQNSARSSFADGWKFALAAAPSSPPAGVLDRVAGFNSAITAIRGWAAGFNDPSNQNRLRAVAQDLENNRDEILALTAAPSSAAVGEAGLREAWKRYYGAGEPNGFYITRSASIDGERIFSAGWMAALSAMAGEKAS